MHDPYAPVSLGILAASKLWRVGFFYLALAAGLAACLRRAAVLVGLAVAAPHESAPRSRACPRFRRGPTSAAS